MLCAPCRKTRPAAIFRHAVAPRRAPARCSPPCCARHAGSLPARADEAASVELAAVRCGRGRTAGQPEGGRGRTTGGGWSSSRRGGAGAPPRRIRRRRPPRVPDVAAATGNSTVAIAGKAIASTAPTGEAARGCLGAPSAPRHRRELAVLRRPSAAGGDAVLRRPSAAGGAAALLLLLLRHVERSGSSKGGPWRSSPTRSSPTWWRSCGRRETASSSLPARRAQARAHRLAHGDDYSPAAWAGADRQAVGRAAASAARRSEYASTPRNSHTQLWLARRRTELAIALPLPVIAARTITSRQQLRRRGSTTAAAAAGRRRALARARAFARAARG